VSASHEPHAALQVVSFDAGGTLFEVAEPVGTTYARLARAAGFDVTADALDEGFRRAFAAAPPLARPAQHSGALLDFERAWWRAVVDASLEHALGAAPPESRAAERARFFDAAFAHYARPEAWRLYPEVRGVLADLARRGLRLIVISNFDRRLHGLLAGFGLANAFAAAIASSEAGAVKPDPAIFASATSQLSDVPAAACLHVGDSAREDVRGALAAGWRAVWLDRTGAHTEELPPGAARIERLDELAALVQSSGS
jgi:putative hydrolase of the HAD superfamily